ncbi:MAG: Rrf2 family transcriptional regulator [Bacteroidales bacterium]|nr:Rrf2 family transcriptional regulator [Bacteroidales bacterium]
MLSNSCRYGIRAVIYLASLSRGKVKTGIKQISKDLDLPSPFLAKILQQLAKQKILDSTKGPHGGFSLLKDPAKISLLDIVRTIDGEEVLTNCIIHSETCVCVDKNKKPCPVHSDFNEVRTELIKLFRNKTIQDLVTEAGKSEKIVI